MFKKIGITFLGFLMVIGMVTTLSACHSKSTQSATGSSKVPAHPKRVVAGLYLGQVMATGTHVVGSTKTEMANPFLDRAKVNQIKDVGTPMDPEAVLKLKPDLIITNNPTDTSKMKKIAPTVQISYKKVANFADSMDYFGKLLNRPKQAAAFKKSFRTESDKQIKRLKAAGISRKKTVGIYEIQNGKLYVFGSGFGRGGQALTQGLGFPLAKGIKKVDSGTGFKEISIESLPKYQADYMFLTSSSPKGQKDPALITMKNNPVWKSLKAVKEHHVIELPFDKMYYYDPYATRAQLKMVTDALIKTESGVTR